MSPKLKPLILPQLVEERRKRESTSTPERDVECASSGYTTNSSSSELTSPLTPTFSARGHLRATSSTSSVDLPAPLPGADTPSSPSYTGSKNAKSSLPDVIEESPEKEDRLDFLEDSDGFHCDERCLHGDHMVQSTIQLGPAGEMDYDLADGFFSDGEFSLQTKLKKPRSQDGPFSTIATRITTRFPSFSRSWRSRKNTISSINTAPSYAASSRSSSISNAGCPAEHLPPTPTRSIYDDYNDQLLLSPIDIEKANSRAQRDEMASTPLLPPLMNDVLEKETPAQSPLQSPTVAEPGSTLLRSQASIDGMRTSHHVIPTPPLSTKPSISSFHRGSSRIPQMVPSPEMPPILLQDADDEWADKLGHANFTIQPEPYIPSTFDIEACRQLRSDWDLARCNYTKHIVRIGEHYGATSKIYKWTEAKWNSIEAEWRRNNELTIKETVDNSDDAFRTLKHSNFDDPNIMTKIPSLNGARSGGKFPQLGDEDIVGPMVQVAAQPFQAENKKAKLFKFFVERFPVGLGKTLS